MKCRRCGRRMASEYQQGHRPTKGVALHKLGDGTLLPEDVMEHPEWYTGFMDLVENFWWKIKAAQGDPNYRFPIYRAIPDEVEPMIREGDWVTLSEGYAKHHAGFDDEEMKIIEATVPAKDLWFPGDDLVEWGYWGQPINGQVVWG